MITGVYAVRDEKTEAFSSPLFFVTGGVALRSFSDECLSVESMLHKHPADYSFYQLGQYDDNAGTFVNLDVPKRLAGALDFAPRSE